VYVEEQYDDNIFLTERGEQDDFITTISPGVNLSYQQPTGEITLDYEFRRSFFNDFSEFDYSSHYGKAEARMDFDTWLGTRIRETFIRSEDPLERPGLAEFETPDVRIGRREPFTRNIVEPEVTFRFGENRSIRLGYRNQILRNDADDIADQDENAGNAFLTFAFNIRHVLEIFYEHIDQEYDEPFPSSEDRDHDGDEIVGKYTYNVDLKTSAYLEYRYNQRDFEMETTRFFDYKIHNPSLGFTRQLYENVMFSATGGYVIRDAEGQKDEEAFSGRLDFSALYPRLTLSLYAETGVDEDYLSAESRGFNEFWRVGFTSRYQFLERLWAETFFHIIEEEFPDSDRRDTLWSARGSLEYQPLRWLFLSFDYEHNERDSNIPRESFENNRYFGRLTVQYDITEFF